MLQLERWVLGPVPEVCDRLIPPVVLGGSNEARICSEGGRLSLMKILVYSKYESFGVVYLHC